MTEEKKRKESSGISRREFLKDAGLVVGGAAIGSTILLAACGGKETTKTKTETLTQTQIATQTVTAAGGTVTESVSKFVDPIDGQEFDTLAELQAHFAAAHPSIEGLLTLNVNGTTYITQVKPNWTLAFVLREKLGLPGTKVSCDRGECGSCTVIVDGRPVYSCMLLATEAVGKAIATIEGLSDGVTLHPVQQAFVDHDATQCGFCAPGFIMSAKALLDKNSNPTSDELREALSGHICCCGTTKRMIEALL
jgi:aerobic-type carbon monoxide dehydrogenase small subunit (CoxS/CutS family)